jgi:hypothetical protein
MEGGCKPARKCEKAHKLPELGFSGVCPRRLFDLNLIPFQLREFLKKPVNSAYTI